MTRQFEFFDHSAGNYDLKMKFNPFWRLIKYKEKKAFLLLSISLLDKSVLDLGSGTGFYANICKDSGANVLAVDKSAQMINILKEKKLKTKHTSIEDLNLSEDFDFILAMGSFEFIPDLKIGFNKIFQHLKKDGYFILMYPRSGFTGWLYSLIHTFWKCPTKIISTQELIKVANDHKLILHSNYNAGAINNLYVFKKKA